MFQVSWLFGSLEDFPDVLMNLQGWECSCQAELPAVNCSLLTLPKLPVRLSAASLLLNGI